MLLQHHGDATKSSNLRVPDDLWASVAARARVERRSANAVVVRAPEAYISATRSPDCDARLQRSGSAPDTVRELPDEAGELSRDAGMGRPPEIVPDSDLANDAAAVVDRARTSRKPVIITQHGRAAAVLVSVEAYERSEYDRLLLRALAQGDREVAANRGYDLDDVLAEAVGLIAHSK